MIGSEKDGFVSHASRPKQIIPIKIMGSFVWFQLTIEILKESN